METRPLGRTGLSVSVLSLGTMTFGSQNTEAEAFEQMDRAIEAGINLFDTAEMYPSPPTAETATRTETMIGNWFAARPGMRDKVLLASKVAGRGRMTWLRRDGHAPRLTAADIEEAVDASLKRLKTDYLDLYQVHWPDRPVVKFGSNATVFEVTDRPDDEVAIETSLEALGRLVAAGKVRHLGVSNESTWGLMKWLAAADPLPRIASIQNAYSLINRTFEVNLAEACMREDVSLLAYSALAQGYLTGKYRGGALPEGARKTLYNRLQRYEGPGAVEANDMYLDLAAEAGLDPAQMAIAFAVGRPFMTSVIIGATRMDQLDSVIAAAEMTLPADLLEKIDDLHRARGNVAP